MADKDPGFSAFIKAVAGDGTSPPDVRVLSGWLGASGEEGHSRLYLDSSLSTYVDIPSDAILYSEEIPNSHPAGQRTVWVKNDADLKEGGSAITRAAKFLFGQVQQDFLGAAAPAKGVDAQATRLCLTYKPGCERTGITGNCESNLNPCGPGPGRPFTQLSCSAIGACGSNVCPAAAARTDSMMGCFDAAPQFRSMTDVCPQTQSGHQCHTNCCKISDFAQARPQGGINANIAVPQTARFNCPTEACQFESFPCPPPTEMNCIPRSQGANVCPDDFRGLAQVGVTRNINQCVISGFRCPSVGPCGSAVDACPSSLGCTFACNFDWTVAQQRQQQFGGAITTICQPSTPGPCVSQLCTANCGQGQAFVGAAPKTIVVTITGTGPLCCYTVIGCPDKSTVNACSTQVPALCPAQMRAANCVGQTFQTGASCPCPQTGIDCQPPATQGCPPVSGHPPQCCFGQTFQTGIQGCAGAQAFDDSTDFCPTSLGCGGAANAGWTRLGCNQHTHYPQCNSSVGICATRPPCF